MPRQGHLMANASRNFGWLRAKQGNLLRDIDNCSDAAGSVLQVHYKALPLNNSFSFFTLTKKQYRLILHTKQVAPDTTDHWIQESIKCI